MTQEAKLNLPRLLVIGAGGFLGAHVVTRGRSDFQVIRAGRERRNDETDVALDIKDGWSVRDTMYALRPDAVILLAAIADIDRCQREPKLAEAVNLEGAKYVAEYCAEIGARLLFTSTGAVFDGLKEGYCEEDELNPVSVYGQTKAHAEIAVRALLPDSIIVRPSLVLGRSRRAGTNSLVDGMISRWKAGEVVTAPVSEFRNPIDADTLSQWILQLIKNENAHGIFHAGSKNALTRYEIAQALGARLNIPQHQIQPEQQSKPGRAPRGPHHFLLTDKIDRACGIQAPSCEMVIERSLHELAQGAE
jgi:dTDP-4-dehydrorhamnose reductase